MKTKNGKREKRSRTKRSAQDRQELVREFKASGLSQAAFCRRKKVHPATFSTWLPKRTPGRSKPKASRGCAFTEVQVAYPEPAVKGHAPIEIELPKGVVIRLREPELLKNVVEFMREVGAC